MGTVVSSLVQEHIWTTAGGAPDHSSYSVQMACEYWVGGTKYNTDQASQQHGKAYREKELAESEAAKQPIGTQMPIYYDPSKPNESVMALGSSMAPLLGVGFGCVFLLTGIVVLVSALQ